MAGRTEDMGRSAWEQLLDAYRAQWATLARFSLWKEPPSSPPPLPWLAVTLTPWMAAATLPMAAPASEIAALGDLERCVAWALVER